MVWVVLYLTHAVPMEALSAIAVALVVLALWVGLSATRRLRRGR